MRRHARPAATKPHVFGVILPPFGFMQCFTLTTESPSIVATSIARAPLGSSAVSATYIACAGRTGAGATAIGTGGGTVAVTTGVGAAAGTETSAGEACAIATSIVVSPTRMTSPLCSFALLIFVPFTKVPRVEPRSMMLTSAPITSMIACMRLTVSSASRRCADGTLPILMTVWPSFSSRTSWPLYEMRNERVSLDMMDLRQWCWRTWLRLVRDNRACTRTHDVTAPYSPRRPNDDVSCGQELRQQPGRSVPPIVTILLDQSAGSVGRYRATGPM